MKPNLKQSQSTPPDGASKSTSQGDTGTGVPVAATVQAVTAESSPACPNSGSESIIKQSRAEKVYLPDDALQMLQAACRECLRAGLAIAAGNVVGRGLVIVVPGAVWDSGDFRQA